MKRRKKRKKKNEGIKKKNSSNVVRTRRGKRRVSDMDQSESSIWSPPFSPGIKAGIGLLLPPFSLAYFLSFFFLLLARAFFLSLGSSSFCVCWSPYLPFHHHHHHHHHEEEKEEEEVLNQNKKDQ